MKWLLALLKSVRVLISNVHRRLSRLILALSIFNFIANTLHLFLRTVKTRSYEDAANIDTWMRQSAAIKVCQFRSIHESFNRLSARQAQLVEV
jgi:hypothetical protein